MGRVIISGGSRATVPYVGPKASLTPTSGVTYTDGLSGLEPSEISSFAQAISNVSGVSNDVTAMYIDYGDVHRKISVGDQVMIGVNNVDYAFDVIGFNHDDLTDSMAYGKATVTGKAGMTLQMHGLLTATAKMNTTNTNSGGWKNCAMRTSNMITYFSQLTSIWQNIVKTVNKLSSAGSQSSTIQTVEDKLFLLSGSEVFYPVTDSFSGEGTRYSYYKAINENSDRIKRRNGSAITWWLRSPYKSSDESFCGVSAIGDSQGINATGSYGVSFAFCI